MATLGHLDRCDFRRIEAEKETATVNAFIKYISIIEYR